MANFFAYFMLVATPLVAFVLYNRMRPATACASSCLFAIMFLPQGTTFKLPGIPELDKEALIYVAVLLASRIWSAPRWRSLRLGRGPRLLILALLASGVGTVFANRDPLQYGHLAIPAHVPYDAVSSVISDLLVYVIPFMLGRALYRTPDDLRRLLLAVAIAGLVYSIPALWEIRFSPQLHIDLYGYAQNEFGKNRRWGGFRPLLFMQSGIAVGVFMASTAVAAAGLQKARLKIGKLPSAPALFFLVVVVVLCKSTAAIIYTVLFVTLIVVLGHKALRWVLMILLILVLSYPVLRLSGSGPTDALVDLGMMINEERGSSLAFRFAQESSAMEHTKERLYLGWGGYARNRVYSEEGEMMSTFDAFYIIITSQRGLIGAICVFGLLAFPVFRLLRSLPYIPSLPYRALGLGTGYIVLVRLFDLMQNGFYSSLPMLVSGALLGSLPSLSARNKKAAGAGAARAKARKALARRGDAVDAEGEPADNAVS